MAAEIYGPCDEAIKAMNRENLKAFGRLKLANFDELNVIRTVKRVYRKAAKEAEKKYRKIAVEAYLYGLYLCGWDERKAEKAAEKAITAEWAHDVLTQTDFVTLYRFDTETERKAERLIEAISGAEDVEGRGAVRRNVVYNRDAQIDQALKLWTNQLAQYAINMTDYALLQAFMDAGVKEAEWVTAEDERVCGKCNELDGNVYRLDDFPSKPHPRCRCTARPVLKGK